MKPLIFNELKKYIQEDVIRYDVPGHKGNYLDNEYVKYFGQNIIKADVNSMQRLDNLNFSTGIIKQSQLNIAKLHNALDARFLVNGTTQGIQVMILASLKPGAKILVPTNIHKSVQSAIILSGAIPIYVNVQINDEYLISTGLLLKDIHRALQEHPDIQVALLINPSYYGIALEFKKIIQYLKKLKIITLVDEAHGGSFYFLKDYTSAMDAGADMSCISYHKTLGTLTQTSLLLYNSSLVSIEQLDKAYTLLNTTSPSYLFMANLEVTILDLFQNKFKNFETLTNKLEIYKKKINQIKGIKVLNYQNFKIDKLELEPHRLVIDVSKLNISGFKVYELLRDKYQIQVELGEFNIILCIISIFDNLNDLDILINSLQQISKKYYIIKENKKNLIIKNSVQKNFQPLREIFYAPNEAINYQESKGRILSENIMLYPPGIALMLPGEVITAEFIEYLNLVKQEDIIVYGVNNDKVLVIKEE
ncbi:MAG: aminotransferase class I/II-fold pyridoxal phosphate-dependent enzyme [Mycoplasmatales bacterium]